MTEEQIDNLADTIIEKGRKSASGLVLVIDKLTLKRLITEASLKRVSGLTDFPKENHHAKG